LAEPKIPSSNPTRGRPLYPNENSNKNPLVYIKENHRTKKEKKVDFNRFVDDSRKRRIANIQRQIKNISEEKKSTLISFMEEMYGQARVNYFTYTVIIFRLGIINHNMVGHSQSLRYIQLLPLKLQPLVARRDGRYAENASREWMHTIENIEVIRAELITTDVDIINAIHTWAELHNINLPMVQLILEETPLSEAAVKLLRPFMLIPESADEDES